VTLDGLAKSRKLRSLRVKLGDVGDGERLLIGIGAALNVRRLGIGGDDTRKLDRRTLYI